MLLPTSANQNRNHKFVQRHWQSYRGAECNRPILDSGAITIFLNFLIFRFPPKMSGLFYFLLFFGPKIKLLFRYFLFSGRKRKILLRSTSNNH